MGICRRFFSSTEVLAFVIEFMWGRRVERNEERMIKVSFIMEKERKL